MEFVSLLMNNKCSRDFDIWPFNRVWLLNGEPFNTGSIVITPKYRVFTPSSQLSDSRICNKVTNTTNLKSSSQHWNCCIPQKKSYLPFRSVRTGNILSRSQKRPSASGRFSDFDKIYICENGYSLVEARFFQVS